MSQEDEHPLISESTGWWLVMVLCLAIVVVGLLIYKSIPDAPRDWDFGALPDAPGQSVYSTQATPLTATPTRQLPMLPEARPGVGPTGVGATARQAASRPATEPATSPEGGRP